jgi:hypothetical protein
MPQEGVVLSRIYRTSPGEGAVPRRRDDPVEREKCISVTDPEGRAVLWPGCPSLVNSRCRHVGVSQPFLDLAFTVTMFDEYLMRHFVKITMTLDLSDNTPDHGHDDGSNHSGLHARDAQRSDHQHPDLHRQYTRVWGNTVAGAQSDHDQRRVVDAGHDCASLDRDSDKRTGQHH